ncbi:hypothetical protein KHA90_23925 [Flavobacterium psychroterrae]|uniref:DUF3168 domain-containing protein n=1 Tax=Flavobacterium psychroterrae TaxID=2133767 RepID=A0ABS5PIE6_9FLAO|nr:hypothetical protein [Flavobacterium psychroterrae]MBS7234057.1 hypothetical protein [Flavobacterium psychroterrae]
MKQFLENTQAQINEVPGIAYIDEDWGQLDDYSPNPPVKWPCCLIDITNIDFSDIGRDNKSIPQNRQEGTGSIVLTFANLKLTNTSFNAPQAQKDDARAIHELIELAHGKIHGFAPVMGSGRLMRKSFKRVKRDDGIQQYQVVYTIAMHNV